MNIVSDTTKSGQLRNRIIQSIADGYFPVGSRLPSERALEEHFGVSRVSVRKALNELQSMGYLARESGCRPVIVSASGNMPAVQGDMAFVTNLNRDILFDVYRSCYEEILQECNRLGIRLTYIDISQPLPAYLGNMVFQAIFVAGDFGIEGLSNELKGLDRLKTAATRVILLDDQQESSGFSMIATDNIQGGELAARSLLERGCRNLMLVGRRAGYHYVPFVDRRSGFINELHKNGISCHVFDVALRDGQLVLDPFREYLARHPEIDGVFTISDALGLEVIHLFNELGRKIPDEVQVVGFDGLSSGELTRPRLSSIAQPVREIAVMAVRRALEPDNITAKQSIPCFLIHRDSTRQ